MGDLLQDAGDIDEAEKYYNDSMTTWNKLKLIRPDDPEVGFEIAWMNNKFGDVLLGKGKDELSLERFNAAGEGIKQLGEDELSTHLRWRHALSIVQNNIGEVLEKQQDYSKAIMSFEDAKIEITKALDHDRNQTQWLSVLAWTNSNLGETRVRWARSKKDVTLLQGAREELEKAYQALTTLPKEALEVAIWQFDVAMSQINIDVLASTQKGLTGDCLGAAHGFSNAAESVPEVTDASRHDETVLRKAEYQEWAGLSFLNAGKTKDGERELRRALETLDQQPKLVGQRAAFAAMKERIKQELRASANFNACG